MPEPTNHRDPMASGSASTTAEEPDMLVNAESAARLLVERGVVAHMGRGRIRQLAGPHEKGGDPDFPEAVVADHRGRRYRWSEVVAYFRRRTVNQAPRQWAITPPNPGVLTLWTDGRLLVVEQDGQPRWRIGIGERGVRPVTTDPGDLPLVDIDAVVQLVASQLVSTADVAKRVGVATGTVASWRDRYRDFPVPVAPGPLWWWPQLVAAGFDRPQPPGGRGRNSPPPRRVESPRVPASITPGELAALFQVCAADPRPYGRRDAALLALLSTGGLLRDEVLEVDLGDYDPATGTLRVAHGTRTVALDKGGRAALDGWLVVRGQQREPDRDGRHPLFVSIYKGSRVGRRRLSLARVYGILDERALQAHVAPPTAQLRRALGGNPRSASVDLSEREKKVIQLRFGGHPRTLEDIGREFGVTRERIRQIESKALSKLSTMTEPAHLSGWPPSPGVLTLRTDAEQLVVEQDGEPRSLVGIGEKGIRPVTTDPGQLQLVDMAAVVQLVTSQLVRMTDIAERVGVQPQAVAGWRDHRYRDDFPAPVAAGPLWWWPHLVAAGFDRPDPRGRRRRGHPVERNLAALLPVCAADRHVRGRRDAALLAVLRASGLGYTAAVDLDLDDYEAATGSLRVTQGTRHPQLVDLDGSDRAALGAWLEVRRQLPDPDKGGRHPLFVSIYPNGRLSPRRLTISGVSRILARRAHQAQLLASEARSMAVADLQGAGPTTHNDQRPDRLPIPEEHRQQ